MNLSFTPPVIIFMCVIGLLGVGVFGLLIVRNLIKAVIALQVLAKGAMLCLVLAGKLTGQIQLGQSMALTVIVADTIVAVVSLALAVQIRHRFGTLDIKSLSSLRK